VYRLKVECGLAGLEELLLADAASLEPGQLGVAIEGAAGVAHVASGGSKEAVEPNRFRHAVIEAEEGASTLGEAFGDGPVCVEQAGQQLFEFEGGEGERQIGVGGNEGNQFEGAGGGAVHDPQKALIAEILEKVNGLFDGDLTDDDQLVYVNNVLKGKLLESKELATQAKNNTKAQFAASPTLETQILNAIMDALSAHQAMSKQALDSQRVREGLKDILLGPGQLYESLRELA